MAGTGGTVHLLVLPNAERFHNKLKRDLESERKKQKPYEVPIEPDLTEWRRFKREVEEERTHHHVKVLIDDDDVIRRLDAYEESEGTITRRLEMKTDEAEDALDRFKMDAVDDPIVKYVLADFAEADDNMKDFHEKWDDKPIVQKVILDTKTASEDRDEIFNRRTRTAGEEGMISRATRRATASFDGLINGKEIEAELVDSVNLVPKMIRSMNRQLDIGIRQIYDRYVTAIRGMYKISAKPFLNLREDMRAARNFADLFDMTKDRVKGLKQQISTIGDTASAQFFVAFRQMNKFQRHLRSLERTGKRVSLFNWSGMKTAAKENFSIFGKSFRHAAKYATDLKFPGLTDSLAGLGPGMKKAFSASISDFTSTFPRLTNSIENFYWRFWSVGKKISDLTGRMGDAFKRLGSSVAGAFGKIGAVSRRTVSEISRGVKGIPGDIRNAAQSAVTHSLIAFNMLRDKIGNSKILGGLQQNLGRAFSKVWNNISLPRQAYNIGRRAKQAMHSFREFVNRDAIPALNGALNRALDSIALTRKAIPRFKQSLSAIFSVIPASFPAVKRGVTNLFEKTRGFMSKHTRSLFGRVKRAGSTFMNFGRVIGRTAGRFGRVINPVFAAIGSGMAKMNGLFKAVKFGLNRAGRLLMGFSRIAIGAFAKMAGVLTSALQPALMAAAAGVAALAGQTAIASVMALGGAILALANAAIVMAPAVVGALGAAIFVLKTGLEGVADASKQAFQIEDAADFEEYISELPQEVQEIARAMREFKPMMDEMKENIQSNMLEGLAPKVSGAMNALFPIFKDGAERIASSWNSSLGLTLDALASPQAVAGVTEIMKGVEDMSKAMEPFLANLVKASGSLASQGAKFLAPLGEWMTGKSEQFFNWSEGLKEIDPSTGESYFDGIVKAGQHAAGQLGTIFGGLSGTLGNVLKAGLEGGQEILDGMADGAQRLKDATAPGTENFEKMVGFMQDATNIAKQLGDLIEPLFGTFTNVMSTLSGVGLGSIGGFIDVAGALESGTNGYSDIAQAFGQNIGSILSSIAPLIESLLQALLPVVEGIGSALEKMLVPAFEALKPVFESMAPLGESLGSAFDTVGEAIGKILAAGLPLVVGSLVTVLNVLLPVLERVFFWIGELGAKFFEIISPMVEMRDGAVNGLIAALKPLVEIIGQGLYGILVALAPLFPILGQLMSDVIRAVTPLIPVLTEIAKVLFVALFDVIQMVMPIFPPLAALVADLADILSDVLVTALTFVLDTFNDVWPAVSTLLEFLINNVIIPVIHILSETFKLMAEAMKWAIENIIIPVLNVMKSVIETVLNFFAWMIDNVVQPAIDRMKEGFERGVNAIKSIWNGLKSIFSNPVKFFIEVVVNKGIVPAWNTVMGWIGKEDEWGLQTLATPGEMNFARGGVLPGYSVGRDNYNFYDPKKNVSLGLAGGEGIMRQEFVSAVGGPKAIDALNHQARVYGAKGVAKTLGEGAAMGFARGGLFPNGDTKQKEKQSAQIDRAIEFMKREDGKPYQWGGIGDPSWDCSGLWSGIVHELNGRDGRSGRLFNTTSLMANPEAFGFVRGLSGPITVGVSNDHMAGTLAGTNAESRGGDGVLWGRGAWGSENGYFPNKYTLASILGEYLPGGSGGGGINPLAWVVGKAKEKFSDIVNKFAPSVEGIGNYGRFFVGMAEKMVSNVVDSLIDKILPFTGRGGGAGSYDGAGGIAGNAESWREMAMEAMRRNGFNADDPAQVNAMLAQIMSESGGIPNRAQEIVDVNGTGASAGLGLLQIIPGTFADYRDPTLPDDRTDPWANMNAALRYYRARYGDDLTTMWGHGHGYFKGGVLDFFDQGGMGHGKGFLPKNVIQPERVLSPTQTRAFNAFVYEFMPELIEEFKRNPRDLVRHYRKLEKEVGRIYTEMRENHISRMQGEMMRTFERRLNGENLQDSPVDLNFDLDWLKRNQENLQRNAQRAQHSLGDAMVDPDAYLEAEKRAREQIEADREAEAKAKEEAEKKARDEAKSEAKDKIKSLEDDKKKAEERLERAESEEEKAGYRQQIESIDKQIREINESVGDYEAAVAEIETSRKEAVDKETKALQDEKEALRKERDEKVKEAKDEKAKQDIKDAYEDKIDAVDDRIKETEKTVSKKFDEQKGALDEQKKADEDRQREADRKEKERIEKAKADGSYYYGYEVMSEDGTPAEDRKVSGEEKAFRGFMESAGDRTGLGGIVSGIASYYDDAMLIKNAADTAFPAWMAALNGDPSGLAYNVAVGQSRVRNEAYNEAVDLGPNALAGIIEMAISGGSAKNSAPFIGQVNSGMTQAELMQTLEHYETQRARRGTGTTRVR